MKMRGAEARGVSSGGGAGFFGIFFLAGGTGGRSSSLTPCGHSSTLLKKMQILSLYIYMCVGHSLSLCKRFPGR